MILDHTLQYKNLQSSEMINKDTINKVIIPRTQEAHHTSDVKYSLTGLLESLSTQDIIK